MSAEIKLKTRRLWQILVKHHHAIIILNSLQKNFAADTPPNLCYENKNKKKKDKCWTKIYESEKKAVETFTVIYIKLFCYVYQMSL